MLDSMTPGWIAFRLFMTIIFLLGLRQFGRLVGEYSYNVYRWIKRRRAKNNWG
jgi:hypothetical protein